MSIGSLLRNVHAPQRRSIAQLAGFQPAYKDSIRLGSASFHDGGEIGMRHSGRGENVSPQLSWSGIPPETEQLLLLIEDPDVPLPIPLIHTIALFYPTGISGQIAEGELSNNTSNRFTFIPWLHTRGYHGPQPLRNQGEHHYGFYLFALDKPIAANTYRQLRREIEGHIIARGLVTGVQSYP